MDMCLTLKIKREELSKLADRVTAVIHGGIYNIDILVENHWEMSQDDLAVYAGQLNKIAEKILFIKEIKRETVSINVLTDIFSPQKSKDPMLTMCVDCPCTQCQPDRAVFKEFTGFENIPFQDYCKKAFTEMSISGMLLEKLIHQPVDWSDLDEKTWFELQLLKGAQHAIQAQSGQPSPEN